VSEQRNIAKPTTTASADEAGRRRRDMLFTAYHAVSAPVANAAGPGKPPRVPHRSGRCRAACAAAQDLRRATAARARSTP
jgi:hypothetical protein